MTEQWSITNPNRNPDQIAADFCESVFPGRKANKVDGKWEGMSYTGSFQLVGGVRKYSMTCNRFGEYRIEV